MIGGKTFDLADCFAEDTHVTTFRTNPNTFVERFATADTNCTIENADGTVAGVFIDATSDEVFVDACLFERPRIAPGRQRLRGFDGRLGERQTWTCMTRRPVNR